MNTRYHAFSMAMFSALAGLATLAAAPAAHASTHSCVLKSTGDCVQQAGSYPLVCDLNATYSKSSNSGCASQCDLTASDGTVLCLGGCFTDYNLYQSTTINLASTYECAAATPWATDVQLKFDEPAAGYLLGSATVTNGYTSTNESTYTFYAATDSSGSNSYQIASFAEATQNYVNLAQPKANGYTYFKFCIDPVVVAQGSSGNSSASGSEVCTGWGNSSEVVSVSSIKLTFGLASTGSIVTGSYVYSDNLGAAESLNNEEWRIRRADDGNGTNVTVVSTSSSYSLTSSDNRKFLQFCVKPASVNHENTSFSCGNLYSVGPLLELYQDYSYGGSSLVFAYRWYDDGQIYNLTDYGFNDTLSSYKFSVGSSGDATLWLFKDINGGGSTSTNTQSANADSDVSNIGSSWNDVVSSFKITWI
jgi:hypothetical protein